jgi:hypothetical protein
MQQDFYATPIYLYPISKLWKIAGFLVSKIKIVS